MPRRSDLQALAERLHGEFVSAEPYPHVVIDDMLPVDTIKQIIEAFPAPKAPAGWLNE